VQLASASRPSKPANQVIFKMASADLQSQPAPSGKGNYFVQVGSFADPNNAERARNDVANTGPVQVVPLEGQSGTVYRVRVGPLEDETQARDALQSVVVAGHTDARLIVSHGMM
jgi:rare lipoprotein A